MCAMSGEEVDERMKEREQAVAFVDVRATAFAMTKFSATTWTGVTAHVTLLPCLEA